MYGNVAGADAYWTARLNGGIWLIQSTTTKNQALQSASDVINRLTNLSGTPDPDNTNGDYYPLDDAEGVVPTGITNATYELALCLLLHTTALGGQANGNIKRTKIGQTETEFFGSQTTWEAAGIPCQSVWQLLIPFMSDPNELSLERVS